MALILEFLLLITFPKIHSQNNACSSSPCGEFEIHHPFTLPGQQYSNSCHYINLTCTAQGIPLLSFPFSGDFYVRDIRYYENQLVLYDPNDCLAGRLLNNSINLSSTPFNAPYTQTYYFYTCPKDAEPVGYSTRVDCLSNPTNVTIASQHSTLEDYGCKYIGSSVFPLMSPDQYDYQGIDDLQLEWEEVPDCEDCYPQSPPPPPQTGDTRLVSLFKSPFMIPSFALLALLLLSCFMHSISSGRNQGNANNSTTVTTASSTYESTVVTVYPGRTTTGIDDSTIECYTEMVVVGENKDILGQGNSSCAICLDAYKTGDGVRRIGKCGHFFHSDCIVLWLKKSTTCPVCRTELTHVQV